MGDVLISTLRYVGLALIATLVQLIVLFGPVLLLGLAMHYVARSVERRAWTMLGRKRYLGLFGWLGTSVHELGHAVFCVLFGHRITKMRLFEPDPEKGTLGYVAHSYNPRNLYQRVGNFFIGIGPIIFGSLVILVAAALLLDPAQFPAIRTLDVEPTTFSALGFVLSLFGELLRLALAVIGELFRVENLTDWKFWLFLYIAFAVGSSVSLSPPDIKGAWSGFVVLLALLLALNLATLWFSDIATTLLRYLSRFVAFLNPVLILALILNLIVLAVLVGLESLRGARTSMQSSRSRLG